MKITDVTTYIVGNPWKNWVFTRVDTDEGIHGIGEATLNGFAKTVESAVQERFVIGEDPFDVEKHTLKLYREVYSDGGQTHGAALSGIEFACWDIMGKVTQQPVYKLIGGRCHERLRVYANGSYRGPRETQSFHDKAKDVVARGYTALKFDPFGAARRYVERADFALALELSAAVRDAVGIAPGFIDTPLADAWFNEFPDPAAKRAQIEDLHPVGRLGTPQDVGALCAFVCSSLAGNISGNTILIDGGRSAVMQDG